jgi:hypothetical protein
MTDTPPTPRKRAPGAGRKPKENKRHLLPIRCTQEEYDLIRSYFKSPEERAKALLLFRSILAT